MVKVTEGFLKYIAFFYFNIFILGTWPVTTNIPPWRPVTRYKMQDVVDQQQVMSVYSGVFKTF